MTLIVIANGCCRWLASKLKGFVKAKTKQLSRKFVETSGVVEERPNRTLRVTFDRRALNPILHVAALGMAQAILELTDFPGTPKK